MVTLMRGSNWKVAVYGREHGVPHFDVEGLGFRCSVGIDTLAVIIGSAPAPVLHAAREWTEGNRALLLAQWQELNI